MSQAKAIAANNAKPLQFTVYIVSYPSSPPAILVKILVSTRSTQA